MCVKRDSDMNEKFPYGYELDAYIDKAFEMMKEDFPWATRDMIAKQTYYGIEKVGDDYQYVSYYWPGRRYAEGSYEGCGLRRVSPSACQRSRLGAGAC